MAGRACVVLSVALAACSNQPTPSGPALNCTGYEAQQTRDSADASALADGGLAADDAPTCLPFSPSNAGTVLSCSIYATLSDAADASACASLGLETPDAVTLRQLRSRQESEWRSAGGADSGHADWSMLPTCLVPRLASAALDDAGSCGSSPEAGWCVFPGVCASQVVFSPTARPAGSLVTIECQECVAGTPTPGM
jgi:hypothetical protein